MYSLDRIPDNLVVCPSASASVPHHYVEALEEEWTVEWKEGRKGTSIASPKLSWGGIEAMDGRCYREIVVTRKLTFKSKNETSPRIKWG